MSRKQREWFHAALFVIPALGLLSFLVRDTVEVKGHTPDGAGPIGALSGGTGIDSSGSTGMGRIDAGTWTVAELSGDVVTSGSNAAVIQAGAVDDAMLANKLVKRIATPAVNALYITGIGVDNELLTIDGRIYEVNANGSFPEAGGDVEIDCNAAACNSTANFSGQIGAAISGDGSAIVGPGGFGSDNILLIADTAGTAGNSYTLTETFTNGSISASTFYDGMDAVVGATYAIRHVITAEEATTGEMRVQTDLSSIETLTLSWEDAGVVTASTIVVSVSGGIIELTEGAAWANNDILNIIAIGTE